MIRTFAAAAAVAVFSTAAYAGDYAAKADEKMAKYDGDGNGVVTEAEFLAAYADKEDYDEAKVKAKFAKLAGDDGELTKAELVAAMEAHHAKKKEKKGDA